MYICFLKVHCQSLPNLRPTSERRMLAVYLHHDSSVLTNVFCTQVKVADIGSGWRLLNFINRSFARRLSWVYSPKTLSLGVGTSPTAATSSACSTWSRGILGALHQPRSETSVLRNYPWSSWWPNSREIWRSFRLHVSCGCTFFGALKNPIPNDSCTVLKFQVIHGNVILDEFMSALLSAGELLLHPFQSHFSCVLTF